MSRFGVLSLLLALGLELGTSLTLGCNDPFCNLSPIDDGADFRDASSSSDSLLRALVGPVFEGNSLRKLHSDEDYHGPAEDFGKRSLPYREEEEEAEEDQGFRHASLEPSEEELPTPQSDLAFRIFSHFRRFTISDNSVICKYVKSFLRKAIEIIRPFFG